MTKLLTEVQEHLMKKLSDIDFVNFFECENFEDCCDIKSLRYVNDPKGEGLSLVFEQLAPYPYHIPFNGVVVNDNVDISAYQISEMLFNSFLENYFNTVYILSAKRTVNKQANTSRLIQLADRVAFNSRRNAGNYWFFPCADEDLYGYANNEKFIKDKVKISDRLWEYKTNKLNPDIKVFAYDYGLPAMALLNSNNDIMLPYAYKKSFVEYNCGEFSLNMMPFVGSLTPSLACSAYFEGDFKILS